MNNSSRVNALEEQTCSALLVPALDDWTRSLINLEGFHSIWPNLEQVVRSPEFRKAALIVRFSTAEAIRTRFFLPDHLAELLRLALSDYIPSIRITASLMDLAASSSLLLHALLAEPSAPASHALSAVRVFQARSFDVQSGIVGLSKLLVARWPTAVHLKGLREKLVSAPDSLQTAAEVLGFSPHNTVFAAIAQWPSYFQYALAKTKELLHSRNCAGALEEIISAAQTNAKSLPWKHRVPTDVASAAKESLKLAARNAFCTSAIRIALSIRDEDILPMPPQQPPRTNTAGDQKHRKLPKTPAPTAGASAKADAGSSAADAATKDAPGT
ncbi:MAG: hypothetical protein ACP5R4_00480 [Armatimonadota bacterium]